jgi:hypothetical protein
MANRPGSRPFNSLGPPPCGALRVRPGSATGAPTGGTG